MQKLIKIDRYGSQTIRRAIRADERGEFVIHNGRRAYLEPQEFTDMPMDDGSVLAIQMTRIIDHWV